MFTDIGAAIEEARYLSMETKRDHVVIQRRGGIMTVRKVRSKKRESGCSCLFSTKSDNFTASRVNTN